jgi:uncharacterized spore protein YtfJ
VALGRVADDDDRVTLSEVLQVTRDQLTARRVFGEPLERDGVTVLPVARLMGGGGGGEGVQEGQQGEGAGFGLVARPAGVYVIRGQDVRWKPAIDVDRLVTTAAVVVVAVSLARALRRHPAR